ncbi:cellodextrin-phosphorylase [Vibrio ishigakensis]|uniref:Cellodextrin-phosphorylase n=1 Tax=Vibrio ishigakensis TaxID=1481914 RepID=A0A0B8QCL9_9VIBR|nr:cellodextrin-phosphorylase [Vibrio ishigakensis]
MTQYVKETGNADFLDKLIPFYQKDSNSKPIEEGTVWNHLCRSIEFTQNNKGEHGLPLLGFADWNDTVNLPTGAESMMVASMFGKALNDMLDLCEYRGETQLAEQFKRYYLEMQDTMNSVGWDGQWYVRYFDEKGEPIGSHKNEQGQIYTNGQSWPVISGFATAERATQALDSVYNKLNTRNGIKLSTPGYNGFD